MWISLRCSIEQKSTLLMTSLYEAKNLLAPEFLYLNRFKIGPKKTDFK